jgi:hypothetical protein
MIGLDEFYDLVIDRLRSIDGITTMKLSRKGDNDCHMISVQFEINKKEILKIELSESEGRSSEEKNIHISTNYRTEKYGYETYTIGNQNIKYIHEKALLALQKIVTSKKTEYEYDMLRTHITDLTYSGGYIEEVDQLLKIKGRNDIIDTIILTKEKES